MLRATAWTAFHSSPVRCSEGETMKRIEKRAYGKINLSLDVVGKREDGYHLVRMVMQTVGISDTLEIVQAQHGEVHLKVLRSDITAGPDNLVCRAAQAMREAFDLRDGFDITLEKHIPAAAGMAGGSADAAAVLTGIRDMYSLWADNTRLREIALPLGADIPYCVEGGTALCEGIGEVLTPLPDWLQCELVVVKPDIDVPTPWVYHEYDAIPAEEIRHPDVDGMVAAIRHRDLQTTAKLCGNVLEQKTGSVYPVIGELEALLKEEGALNAVMTGSGPTVFGIYERQEDAGKAMERLEKAYPGFAKFRTNFVNPKREK